MQIQIEINDETVVLIDEIAGLTGLTREQIVENNLHKTLAEDQERINQRRLKEENLDSEQ